MRRNLRITAFLGVCVLLAGQVLLFEGYREWVVSGGFAQTGDTSQTGVVQSLILAAGALMLSLFLLLR